VECVRQLFPPTDKVISDARRVRLATFINGDVIRTNEFGYLRAYTDNKGVLTVVLDPNSEAKSRSFGRK